MAQKKIKRHPGAIKAHRQSERRNLRNRTTKRDIRLATRAVLEAAGAKDAGKAKDLMSAADAALSKAARKSVIHWKTAARKKSRLTRRIQTLLAAPAAVPVANANS